MNIWEAAMEPRLDDLVEIYAAATRVEGDRLTLLLEEVGIDAIVRETTVTTFPSPVEDHVLLLVKASDRDRARTLIAAAIQDGAVSEQGRLFD
jgi:hypothetical protein